MVIKDNVPVCKDIQLKSSWVDRHHETKLLSRGSLYYSNTKFFGLVKLFPKNKLILANECYKVFCTVFTILKFEVVSKFSKIFLKRGK